MGWLLATAKQDLKAGFKWMVGIVMVMDLLIVPTVTVHIRDEVAAATGVSNPYYSVANVPVSLAVIAEVSTQIAFGLTRLFETGFSSVDPDVQATEVANLSGTGLMFAARLVNGSASLNLTDPQLSTNLKRYLMQCIVPEIMHNNLTVNTVVSSPDIWALFKQKGSIARRFLYTDESYRHLKACNDQNAINDMASRLETQVASAPNRLLKMLGLPFSQADAGRQKAALLSYIPAAYQLLSKQSTDGAPSIIRQAFMANVLNDTFLTMGGSLNAGAMITSFMHIRAGARGALQANENAYQASMLLPWLHVIFSVLLFSLFPLVIITVLMPGGAKRLSVYISALLWLTLWAPISAVLQMIFNTQLADTGAHILTNHANKLDIVALASFQHASANALILSQNLMWAVPTIASFLAFGNYYALNQLVGNATSSEQSGANQEANDATLGNYTSENVQVGNESLYNTQAYKFDSNASVLSGMVSTQTSSGAMITHRGDGVESIQSGVAMSNIPQKLHLSHMQHSEMDSRYQDSVQSAQQEAQTYHESTTSAFRQLFDFSEHVANGHNVDSTMTAGTSYNDTTAYRTMDDLVTRFSKEHGFTKEASETFLAAATAEVGGNLSIPGFHVSGSLQSRLEGSASVQERAAYNDAKELVQSAQFQQSLDKVRHAVQEDHYRGSDEASARLSDSINADFNRAMDASHQMQAHLDQSKLYQSGMQYADSHGVQLDVEKTQEFVSWLATQENQQTGQAMGIHQAEVVLDNQPDLARSYAEEFMQQMPDSQLLSAVDQQIASKHAVMKDNFNADQQQVPGNARVKQAHDEASNHIASNAKAQAVYQSVTQSLDDAKVTGEYETIKRAGEDTLAHAASDPSAKTQRGQVQHEIKKGSRHATSALFKSTTYQPDKEKA